MKGPMEAMHDLMAHVEMERYNVKPDEDSWAWITNRPTFNRLYEDMIAVSRCAFPSDPSGMRGRTTFLGLPIIVSPDAEGISLYDSTPEPVRDGMAVTSFYGAYDPKGGLWMDTWTGIARLKGSQINLFSLFKNGAVFA